MLKTKPILLHKSQEILKTEHNVQNLETRTFLHFHYLDWEDFGVPQDTMSFLHFLLDVRSSGILRPGTGPAVVHCSAGVSRSGVFTLVDVCLSFMERTGGLNRLNVTDILLDLRRQRLGLVKTPEQLRFVYIAIFTAHRALELGQTTEQLKKEVERVMAAYVPPVIVLPPPKLVYVRPYVKTPKHCLLPCSLWRKTSLQSIRHQTSHSQTWRVTRSQRIMWRHVHQLN